MALSSSNDECPQFPPLHHHTSEHERSIDRAASALEQATFLLILAGAGFSADSGLGTYESMPEEYRELCNPIQLVHQPERFQQFWIDFASEYSSCQPHAGYRILNSWCDGGKLRHLRRSQASSTTMDTPNGWWVYTSNVDGHFSRFSSFKDCTCEIHGNATQFRCPVAMGRYDHNQRQGQTWGDWNKRVDRMRTASCPGKAWSVIKKPATMWEECPHCHLPARPNVLMFHDTDENVLESIQQQRDRYQKWEGEMEHALEGSVSAESSTADTDGSPSSSPTSHLVILEFGCGTNVPAVRIESEEVLRDSLCRVKEGTTTGATGGSTVTLVRVNPKDAGIEEAEFLEGSDHHADESCSTKNKSDLRDHVVSIYGTALKALEDIDKKLSSLLK